MKSLGCGWGKVKGGKVGKVESDMGRRGRGEGEGEVREW